MSESEQLHEISDEINAQINLVELKTVVTPTRALLWVAGTTCDPKLCSVKIESYQNKLYDANRAAPLALPMIPTPIRQCPNNVLFITLTSVALGIINSEKDNQHYRYRQ